MKTNKKIMRILSLGLGLTILSCTNEKGTKVVGVNNNGEKMLSLHGADERDEIASLEQQFLETAKIGADDCYDQLKELYPKVREKVIQQVFVNSLKDNRYSCFTLFFWNEVFPDICDDYKKTRNTSFLDFLLKHDLGEFGRGGRILHQAIIIGAFDVVQYLVEDQNVSVDVREFFEGATPLHTAVYWKRDCDDIAKFLIEKGANVNDIDNNWCRPLHMAAQLGDFSVVKLLIDHGACVNVHSREGFSPLDYSLMKERSEERLQMEDFLIAKGGKISSKYRAILKEMEEVDHC